MVAHLGLRCAPKNYILKTLGILLPKSAWEKAECYVEVANHSQCIFIFIQNNNFLILVYYIFDLRKPQKLLWIIVNVRWEWLAIITSYLSIISLLGQINGQFSTKYFRAQGELSYHRIEVLWTRLLTDRQSNGQLRMNGERENIQSILHQNIYPLRARSIYPLREK